jgi:RNA polymerase sigma factor (sigma-70 family)
MTFSQAQWDQIVRDLGPSLYRYFCGSFPQETAADLVQETLIRLVRKCEDDEYQESKGNIKSYAFGIARLVRFEKLKDNSGYDLVEDEKELDREEIKIDSSPVANLRAAILQLKTVEQEIILMLVDHEKSLLDIATELAMPLGTVKSHVHRAKENLRKLMEVE